MHVRRRCLPPGWYPDTPEKTRLAIERMRKPPPSGPGQEGRAGVVPHAGWEYSGSVALDVLSRISRSMDTIVIIGGHLGRADGIVCAFEDAYETPFGPVAADTELLEEIGRNVSVTEDRHSDNTVEVQLPLVHSVIPAARVLGMRAPPSADSERLGAEIFKAAKKLGRRVAVVGSTDLTHYGATYDFSPRGGGEEAVRWVKEVNDRRFIESLLALDAASALDRALHERSACSAGGALAAIGFARASGITEGRLLDYRTSHDVLPAESFVGYAGVLYV